MAEDKKKKDSIAVQAKKALERKYDEENGSLYHVAGTSIKGKTFANFYAAFDSDGIKVYQFTESKELILHRTLNWSDWDKVNIDHFALKSLFLFKGATGQEEFIVNDGSGKRVEEIIRQRSSIEVFNHSRKWYQKILGFRSGKKWKMITAGIIYFIIIFSVIGAFTGEDESDNSTKPESNHTKSTEVTKAEKPAEKTKPVAYKYSQKDATADENGNFSVPITLKEGYSIKLDSDGAELEKKDNKNFILKGQIDKKEPSDDFNLILTSDDDKQNGFIIVDNEVAYAPYKEAKEKEEKLAAEKKKQEEKLAAEKAKEAKKAAAQKKKQDFKDKALANEAKLSYGMLNKSKDGYVGDPYHITKGEVMQATEESGRTLLLVNVTNKGYGIWDDLIAVYYPSTTDAVDDDFIEVMGTLGEKLEYDTQIGGSNSVPSMAATDIKVIGHNN